MDPVYWLALGIVVAAGLLGAGYVVGRATLKDDVRRKEDEIEALVAEIEEAHARTAEAIKQGDAGVQAMGIVLAAKRKALAARRAATPRERRRLLLGGSADSPPPIAAPGQAGTEGGGGATSA